MMEDIYTKYLYFWGSLIGLVVFVFVYYSRNDLRRRMLRAGVAVGIIGILSEGVFFRDYWHPPLLFHIWRFGGVEDFFFGLAFGGICVVLYDVVFHKRLRKKGYPHYWITTVLIISEILAVVTLTGHINSIYASAIGFIIPAGIIIVMRRDLIPETLLSALLGGAILALVEMILLLMAPTYLERYYYLYGKAPLIFGVVPFTEFLWGACFAAIIGPLRDFEYGFAPVNFRRKVNTKVLIAKNTTKKTVKSRRTMLTTASTKR
jgi:hypothetical protein